jgi:hypothetical protein
MPDPAATAVDLFGQPSSATPNTWVASLAADGVLFYYLPPGSYNLVFATHRVICFTDAGSARLSGAYKEPPCPSLSPSSFPSTS